MHEIKIFVFLFLHVFKIFVVARKMYYKFISIYPIFTQYIQTSHLDEHYILCYNNSVNDFCALPFRDIADTVSALHILLSLY